MPRRSVPVNLIVGTKKSGKYANPFRQIKSWLWKNKSILNGKDYPSEMSGSPFLYAIRGDNMI
jgi:hypothetical protein